MKSLTKLNVITDKMGEATTDIIDITPVSVRDGYVIMSVAGGANPETEKEARTREGMEAAVENGIRASRSRFRRHWSALWQMPALPHWPDRTRSFDPARSEVFAFIVRECGVGLDLAQRIHGSAKGRGVIRFDPETLLWRGMPPPWERYVSPAIRKAARERQIRRTHARAAKIEICERCGDWLPSRKALWNHIVYGCPAGLGIAPAAKEDADA